MQLLRQLLLGPFLPTGRCARREHDAGALQAPPPPPPAASASLAWRVGSPGEGRSWGVAGVRAPGDGHAPLGPRTRGAARGTGAGGGAPWQTTRHQTEGCAGLESGRCSNGDAEHKDGGGRGNSSRVMLQTQSVHPQVQPTLPHTLRHAVRSHCSTQHRGGPCTLLPRAVSATADCI